jgi:amino acid adenylation domain-containing protein
MTAAQLLAHLRTQGVSLRAEGDQLRFSAPQGTLTPLLHGELSAHKAEILDFLRQAALSERPAAPPVRAVPRHGSVFPLTFAQQRLWFMDQLAPGNPFFNIDNTIPLRFWLDVPVLERALNEIVRRHEALRTTFRFEEERPVQVVATELRLHLPVVDLSTSPTKARMEEARRLATEEAQKPFDLAQGPLIRTRLLKLGPADYWFLLTMHHMVSDGWSMGIFLRELTALYQAFALRQPSPLPELRVQYPDYAVWQREWLQGAILEEQLTYWKERLADLPVIQLPTDRPRPAIQQFKGAYHLLELPESLTASLKRLSRSENVTLFMVLLAAFKAILVRQTGQEDIVIGSYIANRNRAEIEPLIGFFVNTLVLRTDCSENPTFRALVKRVSQTALGAYAYQDIPFTKLVEELQPERDLSRNPLFQVAFQLFNAPTMPDHQIGGPAAEAVAEIERGTANFDLTVNMWESVGTLRAHFEYNPDLFEASTIARLAGHFQMLLEGVTANADQRLSDLPLLTVAERQRLLTEWNETAAASSFPESIGQLFELQVARMPEAIAFLGAGGSLSYRELDRRANQVANCLLARGVNHGALVGACLERSFELVIALFGILKAGAVYVPLDPAYPEERLRFIVSDSQVRVILTNQRLKALFPGHDVEILCLDEPITATASEHHVAVAVAPDDLAYVVYTSGSTGQPKGVIVPHQQLLNRLAWMWEAYPFEENEVSCQKTALNFVDSLWELLGPLLQGSPTLIVPDEIVKNHDEFIGSLAKHGVTRLWLVPSLLRTLLNFCPDLDRRLPLLKFWVSSGEPLPLDLWQQFQTQMPSRILYNLYGTSEVWDATWFDPQINQLPTVRVPIGRPIRNVTAYILDRYLQPVPIGVPGELHIGGVGVARGYLNRPELTAEKFIPDPFRKTPGGHLYKTGDLARYLPDGNIEYLGRLDHQVKIRGFRIELGEIEAVLAQHPAVRESTVLAHEDSSGDKRLDAYFVPLNGSAPGNDELRRFLQTRLPEPMLPSAFIALDALPLTPNGKIDRRALPAPDNNRPLLEKEYVAPRTPVEEALAAIWAEVLNLDRVGVHDNFFDLGGHSLLATQLVSRVRAALQVDLPLRELFEAPTLAEFALAVLQLQAGAPTKQIGTIPRLGRDDGADDIAALESLSDEAIDTLFREMSPSEELSQ